MADSDFPSDNPVVEEHAPAMIENTNVSQIGINEDTGVCSYDVENLVNSGKRLPKLTEKGRQFQLDVAIKEFNNFLRKFKRCLKNLSVQLTIADDAGALKLAFKAAHSTSSDLENALVNLSGVMDPNDLSFYTSEYEKLDEELSAQGPKVNPIKTKRGRLSPSGSFFLHISEINRTNNLKFLDFVPNLVIIHLPKFESVITCILKVISN